MMGFESCLYRFVQSLRLRAGRHRCGCSTEKRSSSVAWHECLICTCLPPSQHLCPFFSVFLSWGLGKPPCQVTPGCNLALSHSLTPSLSLFVPVPGLLYKQHHFGCESSASSYLHRAVRGRSFAFLLGFLYFRLARITWYESTATEWCFPSSC